MAEQIRIAWSLLLLRAAPQDFPESPRLLASFCALLAVTGVVSAQVAGVSDRVWLDVAAELAFLLVFVYIVLALFRFPERFVQSAIAMTGSAALFNAILIPLNYFAVRMGFGTGEQAGAAAPPGAMLALVYLAVFVWIVRVIGHILRHALEVRTAFAVGIALLYMAGSLVLSLAIHA